MRLVDLNTEDGFSLLELMIAIFILAFGLMATATMMTKGITANSFAHRVTVETHVAYSVLDEVMSMSTNDVLFDSAVSGVVYDLDPSSTSTMRTVQGVNYSATYSITPNNPVTGVTSISVTVTGLGRSITLSSLKRTL